MITNFGFLNNLMMIYLIVLICFMLNFKSILSSLIVLELLVLNIFIFLTYVMSFESTMFLMVYFLVLEVCVGVLGLSILVSLIRLNGLSYFSIKSFSLW